MKFSWLLSLSCCLLAAIARPAAQEKPPSRPGTAGAMHWKIRYLEHNADLQRPDQAPTVFEEGEINQYLASEVELPPGVRSVRLEGQTGVVTGKARVDFDQLKAGRESSNPMLMIFTGVHDVVVKAHAQGAEGQGFVELDSLALDNVQIPRFLLQLFVEKILQPKYPQIGVQSQFKLPDKIDSATVGEHKLIVIQK